MFRPPNGQGWRATIDDVVIRDLYGPGEYLTSPVMWSEGFAACDHPSVVVRWSGLLVVTASGQEVEPDGLVTNYQSYADGGCDNTNIDLDEVGALQITNTERVTPGGAVLALRRGIEG